MVRFVHGELVQGVAGVEHGFLVVTVEGRAEPFQSVGGENLLMVHGGHGEVAEGQTGVSFDASVWGTFFSGGDRRCFQESVRG